MAFCQWELGNHQGWWLQNFSEHQPVPINDCPPGEKGFPYTQPERLFFLVYAQFLPALPHTRVEKPDSKRCHSHSCGFCLQPYCFWTVQLGELSQTCFGRKICGLFPHLYKNYLQFTIKQQMEQPIKTFDDGKSQHHSLCIRYRYNCKVEL